MKKQTLKEQISLKIRRSSRQVFLRADFSKLGEYDQVGRALRLLEKEGLLTRIGYGLYAKARINRITGKKMLAAEGGFHQVARELLIKLRVNWLPTDSTTAYEKGSTQIPVNTEVFVFDRFNRKIGTDKFTLKIVKRAN